ncbi:Co2+/Mg2+ efflux protein ApaG [Candidatus Pantoea edessiphila]|uniref:Co2+/Mg2+ efflux protein ApaG n=1 Tax=Candidatus Pantoea edessiphila TaxID=2044610 RepID=A0A2P5T227_9GAMM|nr:Co2+/Mg2+ efflux protein ApaG [Candidatus Pantoea edessiphila]PPI88637.1 Co2+/Mg2+ efflux protein ApaG [Candidatus Pantoea edessiphila]
MIELTHSFVYAKSLYVESKSYPEQSHYVFTYTIVIRNMNKFPIKFIRRYWLITDGDGREVEIHGEGIEIKPCVLSGCEFRYTSGLVLETPIGTMQGYYIMANELGEKFNLEIPIFRVAIRSYVH